MIAVSIVTVALVSQALLAGYGALATRSARNQFACRQAALAIVNSTPPDDEGGSLPPSAPVEGWSDLVWVDPASGSLRDAGAGSAAKAILVARQWRKGHDGAGRLVFEVSATAVDAEGRPHEAWTAANVILSRRVR